MKLFSVVSLLATALSAANALTINTPTSTVQCQPLLITWDTTGGSPPYILSVVPGNSPSSPALFTWTGQTGNSFSWPAVPVASGTSLVLTLRDSTGALVTTAPFTVQPGTDSSCLTSSSLGSTPAGSSGTPVSSVNTAVTPTTTTPTVSTPTTSRSSTSIPSTVRPSSASSPASTATGSTGGALSNAVNFGSAGLLAILVGAVLA